MVLITIVNGVYKPTYNWGAPHCRVKQSLTIFFSTNHGDLRTIYHLKESKHMFWAFNNPLRSQNYL